MYPLLLTTLLAAVLPFTQAPTPITLDAKSPGRVFDGEGAVSAGASSRLLIDYPEPQRSQILDYLFKPNYGASIQHLKVELGGDVNSTDGCEPSHMHTRQEENYDRGYEWWLMVEAKKRNPDIILDCLEWGAPYWIGDGKFYSQDNADYIVKFIQAAKRVHGLDISYTGIWNESNCDNEWVKLLRRTLDAAGLQRVKIVAADGAGGIKWSIVGAMAKDPLLAAAVQVVGAHYPKFESPPAAKDLPQPVWSSEDGPWSGGWGAARRIAQMFNRNYIVGKMTKTEIWSPITSYYNNLPIAKSGLMTANEPWSGHYEVQHALWGFAHTAQFTRPGWKYIDSGCALLDGGSVASLKSPDGADYSILIETTEAKAAQQLSFALAGLPSKPLHVWHTTEKSVFVQEQDIQPANGAFVFYAEPNGIYSLTTTTGQGKGSASPPPAAPFPLPYSEDFESCAAGTTPRYFSDQSGIFEVAARADGKGKSLRQVTPRNGIEWHNHPDSLPETLVGSLDWKDYEVSTDTLIAKGGFASLFGRVGRVPQNANPPDSYWLKVGGGGDWELKAVVNPKKRPGKLSLVVIGSGRAAFNSDGWHSIGLRFDGPKITVSLDRKPVAEVNDLTWTAGMAGLGCGWDATEFDNFSVAK